MKTIIVYPIPFDNYWDFSGYIQRFAHTFRENPPGADYELWAMSCWGEPTDDVRETFYGIKTKFIPHYRGCDCISTHQAVAQMLDEAFLVCMTTRCFFHRPGWLARFVQAREKHGAGLYGASGSFEIEPHICNRAYAIDAEELRCCPTSVESRQEAPAFEVGPRSITRHMLRTHRPCFQVTWDGDQDLLHCREPEGIFRRGQQNAMLVWDRHTDIFAEATPDEQKRLSALADGISIDSNGEKA